VPPRKIPAALMMIINEMHLGTRSNMTKSQDTRTLGIFKKAILFTMIDCRRRITSSLFLSL